MNTALSTNNVTVNMIEHPAAVPDQTAGNAGSLNPQQVLNLLYNASLDHGYRRTKRKDIDENLDPNEVGGRDLQDYGRTFARLGEVFAKPFTIVQHGLEQEAKESDDEESEEEGHEKSLLEKRRDASWNILCGLIPSFKPEMRKAAADRRLRRGVCKLIMHGVVSARSDDTNSFKGAILNYVLLDTTAALDPFIQSNDLDKSLRGFNHPITASHLMPIEWKAEPQEFVVNEIKSGRRQVVGSQLPSYLFPDGHVLNPQSLDDDLFKGHVVIRSAKHLYMGESSALRGPGYRRGRPGNAAIMGMSHMTPQALAYVAVQVRFALSSTQEWHPVDGAFNYETFFWTLVELLDGDDGKAILDFYDEQLWGPTPQAPAAVHDPQDLPLVDQIRAQRETKRARLTEQAQAAAV